MRMIQRRGAVAFAAASMIAILPAGAVAQDSAVDTVVASLGGAEALGGLSGFVVEASGTRAAIDEGETPGEGVGLAATFESVASVDVAGDNVRIDYSIGASEFGAPREVSEIVTGDIGYFEGKDGNFTPPGSGPLLSDRVTSIRIHQELLNPHLLVLAALADPSTVETQTDLVQVAHGSTPITLTLDADTGLPKEASTMESDPLRRDVELVAEYSDWADTASGVPFPTSVTITYDGETVHSENRTVATDASIDASMFAPTGDGEATFDASLAERGDLSHQYLQSFAAGGFPQDGIRLDLVATEIADPGIFHITGGSHHSLAVIQDEGVVIVEAPLDEMRSAQILSWLETVTDKPVTHVVQSHHHVDHSAGLRSMAGATGATVVAGAAAVPLYEDAFTADSEVVPDGVDGSGIEIMPVGADPVALNDSTNAVTVYPFGNAHAEDYVLVDAAGTLWVVDIFSPQTGAPFPQFLADFVSGAGLEISQVAGGHGGVASLEELTAG